LSAAGSVDRPIDVEVQQYVPDPVNRERDGHFRETKKLSVLTSETITLPRGFTVAVFARPSSGRVIWPPALYPRAGQSLRINASPLSTIELEKPADPAVDRAYFFMDFASPLAGEPERIDALMGFARSPIAEIAQDGTAIIDVPPVDLHLLLKRSHVAEYYHISMGSRAVPSSNVVEGRRTIAVDGDRVPTGAHVYPGALDLNSAAKAAALRLAEKDMGAVVAEDGSVDMPRVRSDDFTLFDSGRIAHLRPQADGVLGGSWLRGSLVVNVAGSELPGTLRVRNIFIGTGRMRSQQVPAPIERALGEGATRTVLSSLSDGVYELEWTGSSGRRLLARAEIRDAKSSHELTIGSRQPP